MTAPRDHLAVAHAGAPAVVVVHDWFGLLPHVATRCDELAAAGITALAVDLYDGRSTTDNAEAEDLMGGLGLVTARQRLAGAVRRLRGIEAMAPRVAAIGYSMGGWLVLGLAAQGLFDAAVSYYAVPEPDETVPLPCPVQLHLAEIDEWDPPDAPEQFVAALRADHTPVDDRHYPGTRHSFANPDTADFDAAAATAAWDATLAFLDRTLAPA